jgi:hypothetical protein
MDNATIRDFFTQPTHLFHRQYEALRAVFVEGRTQSEVAKQFGFTHGSLRQLVYAFRADFPNITLSEESPFFALPPESRLQTLVAPTNRL